MLLTWKRCHKNVNQKLLHLNVCPLSLMIFKIMLMTRMLVLMKVYFSLFVCRMTQMNAQKCY